MAKKPVKIMETVLRDLCVNNLEESVSYGKETCQNHGNRSA